MKRLFPLFALALLTGPQLVFAAIGCTLSNPAQDIKYLYPEMTTYKEELYEFPRLKDGAAQFRAFRERLASDLDPIYETYETPYTVYTVFKGPAKIGIVHGVNVPGKGGVIQVFLSLDPATGAIRSFFFQRLESPAARELRDKEFRAQFTGLSLADFYKHDYYAVADPHAKADRVAAVKAPGADAVHTAAVAGAHDYQAALRGIRKNLVLLDFFVYGRKFDPFFDKAKQSQMTSRSGL